MTLHDDEMPEKSVPVATSPPTPRNAAYARKMSYLILSIIIIVFVPAYVYHQVTFLRAVANDPISRVLLFGEPLDPHEMARRLNADGELVDMTSMVAKTADSCANTTLPDFPRGQPTAATFTVDGAERHAVVYVPKSYPSAVDDNDGSGVPMLVLFHGLNDNCEHFLNATGFLPYADDKGFVIVSACGSQGYLGTAWNAGMCCGFSDEKPDDVAFARQIVTDMRAALCIDSFVGAVGFSNGAMLTEVLACEATDLYAAVASIGGVEEMRPGGAGGLAKCTAAVRAYPNRTSVLMVHGTSDVMVPWGGNRLLGFPSVEDNVAGWVERNDCPADNPKSTISTKKYSNAIYGECGGAAAMSAACGDEETKDAPVAVAAVQKVNTDVLLLAEDSQPPFLVDKRVLADVDTPRLGRKHRKDMKHHKREADDDEEKRKEKKHDHKHPKHDEDDDEEERKGKKHDHPHGPKHGPPHKGGKHPPPPPHHGPRHGPRHPPPPPPKPEQRPKAECSAESGPSVVELVRVEGGGHSWPEDDEFSTTFHILSFFERAYRVRTNTSTSVSVVYTMD